MVRKSNGFTLYETLLVLVMVSGLAILVTFQGQRRQYQLAEQSFWPSWQRLWTVGRQKAIQQQAPVTIKIDSRQHLVWLQVTRTHRVLGRLVIPQTLRLIDGEAVGWVIYPSGTATARQLTWYSTASQQWFRQTFQLGGAIFYVEATDHRP